MRLLQRGFYTGESAGSLYNQSELRQPMADDQFIDYYELMQISPSSETETVQRVYKALAARYHPDNPRTGDAERFKKLKRAQAVLCDSRARAAYDAEYSRQNAQPIAIFETREFNAGMEGEKKRRMGLLCLLYGRRRSNPDAPGLSILDFERLMSCPREHLMFTVWYLKDAQLIRQDQASDFAITSLGVEHVEKNVASYDNLQKLLKSAETGEVERSWAENDGAATRDETR